MSGKTLAGLAVAFLAGVGVTYSVLHRFPEPKSLPVVVPQETPSNELQLTGKLRARNVIDVAPPQDGIVIAYLAEVGQDVYEGQLLARLANQGLETERDLAQKSVDQAQEKVNSIESQIITARLEASRARADAARARSEYDRVNRQYERQKFLYSEGATPRQTLDRTGTEFESAKSTFESLDANARRAEERAGKFLRDLDAAKAVLQERQDDLDYAQEHLSGSEVISPAQGVLIARKADIGQPVVRSMTDFIQIATRLEEMEAVLDAPPPVLKDIRPGQEAQVIVADLGGEALAGKVKGIDRGQVIVEFRNPNPAIRPDVSVLVTIKLQQK